MHLSPLRNSIISIVTDLWRKINIVTKQNALFNKKLNFLTNFRSVLINLHKGVPKEIYKEKKSKAKKAVAMVKGRA